MKTLILTISLLMATTAFAQQDIKEAPRSGKIRAGDIATYTVSDVKLVGVRTPPVDCPPNAMCLPASFARVTVGLGGCLDRVLSVASNVTSTRDGKIVVNLAVTAVRTKASQTTRCIVQATEQFDIFIGGGFAGDENVVINNLAGPAATPPINFP